MKFHPSLTGSKLPLLEHCTAFASPDAVWTNDEAGPDARFGLSLHAVAEASILSKVAGEPCDDVNTADIADSFGLDDDQAVRLMKVAPVLFAFVEKNALPDWRVEVPFAWNPLTGAGRELKKTSHRAYEGKLATELCMTLDLLVIRTGTPGRIIVLDFKSGWRKVAHPSKNRQLLSQACAAASAYDADDVLLVVASLDDNELVLRETIVDAFDLEAHRAWIVERLTVARTDPPRPGEHCVSLYCPAKGSCPAVIGQLDASLATISPTTHSLGGFTFGPPTGPEHARWLVSTTEIVRVGLATIEKHLRKYADDNGGVPMGDGRVWKCEVGRSETIDMSNPKAEEVLRAMGAEKAIDRSPSVTWKSLTDTCGKDVMQRIRQRLSSEGLLKKASRKEYKVTG